MRTSKFSESQIVGILREQESGRAVADLCREHGISAAAFYKWRSKYGGLDASMLRRVKELEAENARLKRMYAESQMEAAVMKEALAKKW
jgi:putative transposase